MKVTSLVIFYCLILLMWHLMGSDSFTLISKPRKQSLAVSTSFSLTSTTFFVASGYSIHNLGLCDKAFGANHAAMQALQHMHCHPHTNLVSFLILQSFYKKYTAAEFDMHQ